MEYREKFLTTDGLRNLESEVCMSLLPHYKCDAGCSQCYIRDKWEDTVEFTEPTIDIDALHEVFGKVTFIDDLKMLKEKAPGLYKYYVDNSSKLSSSNLTDKAIGQQLSIFINDMNFTDIQEITVFDHWVKPSVLKLLDKYTAKYKLHRLKIVISDLDYLVKLDYLVSWSKERGIDVLFHKNIGMDNVDYPDEIFEVDDTCTFYSEGSSLFNTLNSAVYFQGDGFYFQLDDALKRGSVPFYKMKDFNIRDFLVSILKGKAEKYREYCNSMNNTNNKYYEYFNNVSKDLVVNSDYTFIPGVLLPKYYECTEMLKEEGFQETPYGLFYPSDKVIPIVEWRSLRDGL